jgi:hypothetical protein
MSKESKGKCKYCHLSGHVIDKCPTIICKHCKAIGHPNWLCKINPNAENVKSPLSPNLRNKKSIYAFDSTNSLSKSSNNLLKENTLNELFVTSSTSINNNDITSSTSKHNDINKSINIKNEYVGFKDDFRQKVVENKSEAPIINLRYYQKMINSKWGDLIENI